MSHARIAAILSLVLSTVALAEDARTLRDIEYAKPDGRPIKLDLFVPASDKPVPLIIYVHGGGWRSGSKDRSPAVVITRLGYACASIDYRLTDVAPFPAQIHDCKAAVRFLRANAARYNLDPDRIGVWGSSAGGHLVALLGTTADDKELEGDLGNPGVSSRVSCVCDFFGPTNLLSIAKQSGRDRPNDDPTNAVTLLLGGTISAKTDLARLASPVTHVSSDDAPFLILHGDKDALVPIAQSDELAAVLRKAGVSVTYLQIPGAGHGFSAATLKEPRVTVAIAGFFAEHLKRRPATRPAGATESPTTRRP